MIKRFLKILFILLLSCNVIGNAQKQFAEHYDTNDLLSANIIYHIYRDHSGFIWFSTDQGIVKYDGTIVQKFTQASGLPDNTVYNCYEDSKGRIWPFCGNADYCYILGDSIYTATSSPLLASLPKMRSFLVQMQENAQKDLLFISGNHQWVKLSERSEAYTALSAFYPIISKGFLKQETIIQWRFEKWTDNGGTLTASYAGFNFKDKAGRVLWKITDPKSASVVTDICMANDSEIVICDYFGARLVNVVNHSSFSLLSHLETTGCCTDLDGNIWITTKYNGLYKFHREFERIQYLAQPESSRILSTAGRQLFVIRQQRLSELNIRKDTIRLNAAQCNISDHQSLLLFQNGIFGFFDPFSKILHVQKNGRTIINSVRNAKALYLFNDTLVSVEGFCIGIWSTRLKKELRRTAEWNKRITASCKSPYNGIYFIVTDSLMHLDLSFHSPKLLCKHPKLSGTSAISLCGSSFALAGTNGSFYMLDSNFRKLTAHNYPKNILSFIELSGQKTLVHTTSGDYVLDHTTLKSQYIRYPFSSDQLKHTVIANGKMIALKDGKIVAFDTGLINRHSNIQKCYLQKLVVNNRIYHHEVVHLKPTNNIDIQIWIGLLNFSEGRENLYYRIMENKDSSSWSPLAGRVLQLKLHRSGAYSIEITDELHQSSLFIKVYAPTPFLQSRIFKILLGAVIILISWVLMRWLKRKNTLRQKKELEFLKLEHRSLNALLNPHFIFNALNNIQNLINKADKERATEYLATLSRLIRHNLENLKESLIPLQSEVLLIERYIRLQNLRFDNRITLTIDNKLEQSADKVMIPPLLIHSFVENSIVHGISGGDNQLNIAIRTRSITMDYMEITILDNGKGLKDSILKGVTGDHSSTGIRFNQMRIERWSKLYNVRQSISLSDSNDNGYPGVKVTILLYMHLRS